MRNIALLYVLLHICNVYCNLNDNQPFGTIGKMENVNSFDGFMNPIDFIGYIQKRKPILFKNAARYFPAFKLWDDDYFLGLDIRQYPQQTIHVEQRKKENRSVKSKAMNFHQFIRLYNMSSIYMVDRVPDFLMNDILVPWLIKCEFWKKHINQVLMWFSSGGTKSVVHTDDMENINCLIRGEKKFVFVDPARYGDKIPIQKNGSYSDIDVDKVDLTKYPGLDSITYQIVNMSAGDCLYIPKLHIHQVQSFWRNIAVNIWFDHPTYLLSTLTDEDLNAQCRDDIKDFTFFKPDLFLGLDTIYRFALNFLYDEITNLSVDQMMDKIGKTYGVLYTINDSTKQIVRSILQDIVSEFDFNHNAIIDSDDFKLWDKDLSPVRRISSYVQYMKSMLNILTDY